MKNKKLYIVIIIIGVVGALLLFSAKFKQTNKENTNISLNTYTTYIEDKIESFLLSVDGIKNVRVIVTLEDSGEKLYINQGSFLKDYSGNGTVTSESYPSIRGVAIACTNGDNDFVKNRITKLISAYLGISTNRIEIVSFG